MFNNRTKNLIARSDSGRRFVTKADLESAQKYYREATASIKAAEFLTENADKLINESVQKVYPEAQTKSFATDIGGYLSLITNCLIAGSTAPVDEYLMPRLMPRSAQITNVSELRSSRYIIKALKYIKENHGLTGAAREANQYIDYIINALS